MVPPRQRPRSHRVREYNPLTTVCVSLCFCGVTLLQVATVAAQEPSLKATLERAADYTRRLHAQLSGIVAEEVYLQEIPPRIPPIAPRDALRRALRSDLLLVKPADSTRYVEFRDVFEVDGVAVRDRQERLTKLFLSPSAGDRRRLGSIITESARYNIGDIPRNINTPLLPLSFLLPDMQPRFRFERARSSEPQLSASVSDPQNPNVFRVSTEMWVVAFNETKRPTVIRSNGGHDFHAAGRFWIDPDTGAVLMSELVMDNRAVRATINVSYQSEPVLGFLVPAEMREHYEAQGQSIDGRATYGAFRQFQVTTNEVIGRPPGLE